MKKKKNPVFGCNFEDNKSIPIVVRKVVYYFEENGFDFEGIFRVSGNRTDVEQLKKSFDSGKDVDISNENPHVNSNLLKLYLRELPEPLLTFKAYDQFLRVADQIDEDSEFNATTSITRIIETLPETNRIILKFLVNFLHKISLRYQTNKMRAENLAIVFSPNLLKSPNGSALASSSGPTKIVEIMIDKYDEIFMNEPDCLTLPKPPQCKKQDKETLSSLRSKMNLDILKSKLVSTTSPPIASESSSGSSSSSSGSSSNNSNSNNNNNNNANNDNIVFKTNWSHSNRPNRQSMLKRFESELQLIEKSNQSKLYRSTDDMSSGGLSQTQVIPKIQTARIVPPPLPPKPSSPHSAPVSPTSSPTSSSFSPSTSPTPISPIVIPTIKPPPVPKKSRLVSSVPVNQNLAAQFDEYKSANSPLSSHRSDNTPSVVDDISSKLPYRPIRPPRIPDLISSPSNSPSASPTSSPVVAVRKSPTVFPKSLPPDPSSRSVKKYSVDHVSSHSNNSNNPSSSSNNNSINSNGSSSYVGSSSVVDDKSPPRPPPRYHGGRTYSFAN